ncbi:hypothetical protein CRYUN_Cryun34aG0055200 [Craigia yunnanensis]
MSAISGQSTDAIKKALSVHVILDYYDVAKLENLATKTTLTTLYQQSGKAQNQQGFLNVTHVGNGPITFGSADPGSNLDSVLLKTISTQPYNISVLQISNIISVGPNTTTPSSPPAQAPAVPPLHPPAALPPRKVLIPPPTPKESPAASSPNPSNATAPSTDTLVGSNSRQAPAVSPQHPPAASPPRKALASAPNHKESPAASPPNQSNATAPSTDTPTGSLSNPVADGPGSDDKTSAVSLTAGNYLASILMVFTLAWFLLTLI